jgi:hypothetical protein
LSGRLKKYLIIVSHKPLHPVRKRKEIPDIICSAPLCGSEFGRNGGCSDGATRGPGNTGFGHGLSNSSTMTSRSGAIILLSVRKLGKLSINIDGFFIIRRGLRCSDSRHSSALAAMCVEMATTLKCKDGDKCRDATIRSFVSRFCRDKFRRHSSLER